MQRRGNANIEVCDASGRMVKSLVEGMQKPGKYTSVWNATDQRGRTVPRGIYFYGLDTPDYRNVKKAVLMR